MKFLWIIILVVLVSSSYAYVSNSTLSCGLDGWDWETPGEVILYNVSDESLNCSEMYAFNIASNNQSFFSCNSTGIIYDCSIDTSNSSDYCFAFYNDLILSTCNSSTSSSTSTSSTTVLTSSTVAVVGTTVIVIGTTIPGPGTMSPVTLPVGGLPNGTWPSVSADTLPNSSGGLGNRSGIGGSLFGVEISWFWKLLALVVVSFVTLSLSAIDARIGLSAGVIVMDFFCFIVGDLILPMSLVLLFHVFAAGVILSERH